MLKIAITGNIGSGKSEVEKILINKGYKTICADRVSSQKFKEKEDDILKLFNTKDRLELGQIVFEDKNKKKQLENILHPLIKNEIQNFLDKNKNEKMVFAFIPLLYEAGWNNMFDKCVLIFADKNIRLKRILKRNNYDISHAKNRINAQINDEEKMKICDFVIKNEGTFEELEQNVGKFLEEII